MGLLSRRGTRRREANPAIVVPRPDDARDRAPGSTGRDFLRSWKRLNPDPPAYPILSDDDDGDPVR